MFYYQKLIQAFAEAGMTMYQLEEKGLISRSERLALERNGDVNTHLLEALFKMLEGETDPMRLVEYVPDPSRIILPELPDKSYSDAHYRRLAESLTKSDRGRIVAGIRFLLAEQHHSQVWLSQASGIPISTLHHDLSLRGTEVLSWTNLHTVLARLHVPLEYLLFIGSECLRRESDKVSVA